MSFHGPSVPQSSNLGTGDSYNDKCADHPLSLIPDVCMRCSYLQQKKEQGRGDLPLETLLDPMLPRDVSPGPSTWSFRPNGAYQQAIESTVPAFTYLQPPTDGFCDRRPYCQASQSTSSFVGPILTHSEPPTGWLQNKSPSQDALPPATGSTASELSNKGFFRHLLEPNTLPATGYAPTMYGQAKGINLCHKVPNQNPSLMTHISTYNNAFYGCSSFRPKNFSSSMKVLSKGPAIAAEPTDCHYPERLALSPEMCLKRPYNQITSIITNSEEDAEGETDPETFQAPTAKKKSAEKRAKASPPSQRSKIPAKQSKEKSKDFEGKKYFDNDTTMVDSPAGNSNQADFESHPEITERCAICLGDHTRRSNQLQFCDGSCYRSFHQKCYDMSSHPEGRFCRDCQPAKSHASDSDLSKIDDNDDDELCTMCEGGNSKKPNEIICCDGCNLAVHQECYGGLPEVPQGAWFCSNCHPKRMKNNQKVCQPKVTKEVVQSCKGKHKRRSHGGDEKRSRSVAKSASLA